jgi:hypothetical protein
VTDNYLYDFNAFIITGMDKKMRETMLLIELKKREEYKRLSQGKTVFYSFENKKIHYFTPVRVNETDVLFVFDSETPLPFREEHDFKDLASIHVWQLIEIDALHWLNDSVNTRYSELQSMRTPSDISGEASG